MTKKRFTEVYPNIIESSCSFRDNGKGITHKEVVDLLNAQHGEIQSLKKGIEDNIDSFKRSRSKRIQAEEENEQLKQQIKRLEAQLHCPFDSICINCINEYLVQKDKYYVSKCRKGHEQCSKSDVKYCDDFELKGDVE